MVWSSDETRLFVKLYLGHKCLWNSDDADYKHKATRQEAYRDISKKFQALTHIQMTEQEIRVKIKNLRSTYCQEVKKLKLRDGGDPSKRCKSKSNLKWFDDFHKCFSTINIPSLLYEKRSDDDPQEPETEAEDSSQKIWTTASPIDHIENNEIETDDVPLASDPNGDYILLLKSEPDHDPMASDPDMDQKPYNTRKRKHRRRISSSDQDTVAVPRGNDDEYDIYGKYIAFQLRCMGVERAMRVQLQIQSIVSEARISALTGKKKK